MSISSEVHNQAEWENLDNWSHPQFGLYFSKQDTRIWVPKKLGIGWTLNMGHAQSVWWFAGLFLGLAWLAYLAGLRRR